RTSASTSPFTRRLPLTATSAGSPKGTTSRGSAWTWWTTSRWRSPPDQPKWDCGGRSLPQSLLVVHANPVPEDEVSAFPATVDENEDHDCGDPHAGRGNEVIVAQAQQQVHDLE